MTGHALTDVEREILTRFVGGEPLHEISRSLGLSVSQVRGTVEDLCEFSVGMARHMLNAAVEAPAEMVEPDPFRIQAPPGITADDLHERDHPRLLDDTVRQAMVVPDEMGSALPAEAGPRYEVIATSDVLERVDQWWCPDCGGRYRQPSPIHGTDCTRRHLQPVTVLIVRRSLP